jgi:hypothetical protein
VVTPHQPFGQQAQCLGFCGGERCGDEPEIRRDVNRELILADQL